MIETPEMCKGCKLNYERFCRTKEMSGIIKGCTYQSEIKRLEQSSDGKMKVRCSFRKEAN